MSAPRTWVVLAGTLIGAGAVGTGAAVALNDRQPVSDVGPGVEIVVADPSPSVDPLAQSADSPNRSAADSVDSAADSPDEARRVAPTRTASKAPAPSPSRITVVDSADTPIRVTTRRTASAAADSADSPVRVATRSATAADSADSPASPASADSADSPASPASADSADSAD